MQLPLVPPSYRHVCPTTPITELPIFTKVCLPPHPPLAPPSCRHVRPALRQPHYEEHQPVVCHGGKGGGVGGTLEPHRVPAVGSGTPRVSCKQL